MIDEQKNIDREAVVHGVRWNSLHDGYFSDARVAKPLIEAVLLAADVGRPDIIADLGGGTGFVLKLISSNDLCKNNRLVNVDISPEQLAQCDIAIERFNKPVSHITRSDLKAEEGNLMLLMRSMLHYFGKEGLVPLLGHLRLQLRKEELLVHQTACFESQRDAQCLNLLYEGMRTDKWYPSLAELREILKMNGWHVVDVKSAPPLTLTSSELAERYQLTREDIAGIRKKQMGSFGAKEGVFMPSPEGFTAWLHYFIFTCRAA